MMADKEKTGLELAAQFALLFDKLPREQTLALIAEEAVIVPKDDFEMFLLVAEYGGNAKPGDFNKKLATYKSLVNQEGGE